MENKMTKKKSADDGPSIAKLTKTYIKIRDARAKLKAEYDAEDGKLLDAINIVKRELLAHCDKFNVESVRTPEGLFYRTLRKRYWTNDWASMYKFILDREIPEFFEKRLNQSALKEFLEENPDVTPPGLNVDSAYSISVRKK